MELVRKLLALCKHDWTSIETISERWDDSFPAGKYFVKTEYQLCRKCAKKKKLKKTYSVDNKDFY